MPLLILVGIDQHLFILVFRHDLWDVLNQVAHEDGNLEEELDMALRLHGPTHDPEGHEGLAPPGHETGNERVVGSLPGSDAIGMAFFDGVDLLIVILHQNILLHSFEGNYIADFSTKYSIIELQFCYR